MSLSAVATQEGVRHDTPAVSAMHAAAVCVLDDDELEAVAMACAVEQQRRKPHPGYVVELEGGARVRLAPRDVRELIVRLVRQTPRALQIFTSPKVGDYALLLMTGYQCAERDAADPSGPPRLRPVV